MKTIRIIITQLTGKPKILFLADSLGAMLTAFCLFVVLRNFNEYVGMPVTILTWLSVIAACFCIYSITCFLFVKQRWATFIKGIAMANLVYCILTTGLLLIYYPLLTTIGIVYFLTEIAIICVLVYIELTVAAAIKRKEAESNP
jgi:hypothetical protein